MAHETIRAPDHSHMHGRSCYQRRIVTTCDIAESVIDRIIALCRKDVSKSRTAVLVYRKVMREKQYSIAEAGWKRIKSQRHSTEQNFLDARLQFTLSSWSEQMLTVFNNTHFSPLNLVWFLQWFSISTFLLTTLAWRSMTTCIIYSAYSVDITLPHTMRPAGLLATLLIILLLYVLIEGYEGRINASNTKWTSVALGVINDL